MYAEFLGRVRLAGSVASLIGVGVYNYMLKDVPLRNMFFWTAIIGTALGMTQLVLVTGMDTSYKCSVRCRVTQCSVVWCSLVQADCLTCGVHSAYCFKQLWLVRSGVC